MDLPDLQPGQVWSYRAREGEEDSRITILQIDQFGDERIVHIAVTELDGMNRKHPEWGDSPITHVGHMAVMEKRVRNDLLEIKDRLTEAPPMGGYDIWKEAFEKGEAGPYDEPMHVLMEWVEYMHGSYAGTIPPELEPGQIWSYKTRPGEEDSRIVILHREESDGEWIAHVAVIDLRGFSMDGRPIETITHMPYAENVLQADLLELTGHMDPLPDYQKEYKVWEDEGRGMFTVPVRELLQAMESNHPVH